jgi:hypothetical protein
VVEVEVFDLRGKSILQQTVKVNAASECLVEIPDAKSGPYQIRMSAGSRSFIGILIIL